MGIVQAQELQQIGFSNIPTFLGKIILFKHEQVYVNKSVKAKFDIADKHECKEEEHQYF